jgi:hypothetical protein
MFKTLWLSPPPSPPRVRAAEWPRQAILAEARLCRDHASRVSSSLVALVQESDRLNGQNLPVRMCSPERIGAAYNDRGWRSSHL